MLKKKKDFLSLSCRDKEGLLEILERGRNFKETLSYGSLLSGSSVGCIYETPSTRTRVSFEVGINKLGGNVVGLDLEKLHISRGEEVGDTARILSLYLDALVIRCKEHSLLEEIARFSGISVINGLTDVGHPCQVLSDIMTYEETKGSIDNAKIAWIGDYNNMAISWIEAAKIFGFELRIATPFTDTVSESKLLEGMHRIEVMEDKVRAGEGVDAVMTDAWTSLQEYDQEDNSYKSDLLKRYKVDVDLMSSTNDAVFMHCLPAYRGREVSGEVIDGDNSIVFRQAENRLYTQMGILIDCIYRIN